MERTRKIIIILIALVALISVAQAITNFPITADKITDSSIVWNLTQAPFNQSLSSIDVYVDGIEQGSDTNGNEVEDTDFVSRTYIVVSSLKPGEYHNIYANITANSGTIYHGYALVQTTSTGDTAVWQQIYIYLWAIATILLFIVGFRFFRLAHLLAFAMSIIGLMANITSSEGLNFASITFWIYIALIFLSLIFYALNEGV